jgi:hypothetical protein
MVSGHKEFYRIADLDRGHWKYAGITAIINLSVTLEIFDRRRRTPTTYTVRFLPPE